MTARRCRDDMIERSDSAERIEATLAKDPMANAEPPRGKPDRGGEMGGRLVELDEPRLTDHVLPPGKPE